MEMVNEGTTSYLSANFKNKLGVDQEPTEVYYRIDDIASGTVIRAATSIDPASTVEIEVTSTDNRILNQSQSSENRRITVVASYGDDDKVTSEYVYRVQSLSGVTGNPPDIVE